MDLQQRGAAALACSAILTLSACAPIDRSAAPLQARPGALQQCVELVQAFAHPRTQLASAAWVAAGQVKVAGQDVPEHCLVTGRMNERTSAADGQSYAIGFQMRLPKAWNGRFYHQGNGGIDGAVVTATGPVNGGGGATHALMMGFAVLSSDAGHAGALGPFFGLDPQARLDYGYQAVGKLTPMAKSVITTAYGKAPDRSYFGGCSNGGRHTLVAASRYGDDYDGFLAGAPGYNLPKAALANIFGAQRYASVATNPSDIGTGFTAAERQLVSAAVLARCDALDGAADGMVQDVRACQAAFSLDRDVPTCSGARDGSCLSAAQKTAIAPIFSGAVTSTGAPVYSSFPYDTGLGTAGVAFWEFFAPMVLDSGAVGVIFKVPPEPAQGFNGPAFTLGANIDTLAAQINATNATYTESAMSFMTPPAIGSNLQKLKYRGAKVMVYHGVSDTIFSWDDTVHWLDTVRTGNGGGDPSNFARIFPVPGMNHCSGGPSTDQFDMLTPLVNWVEKGIAPDRVVAQARGAGNAAGVNADLPATWSATRSRPLCPYPQVARYNGSGNLEEAASFSCR